MKYVENKVEQKEQINDLCIQMIEDYHGSSTSVSSSTKYFTVKTINVEWESSKNSLMHVFINITNIKKLEKEKAVNKCLHIMFASISHEFRTPLNAFINALDLIQINFEKLLEQINAKVKSDIEAKSIKLKEESINRSIMTAKISSKSLLFLTEDILDFAKIEAGLFSLNERQFLLKDMVNEVVFMFESQWKQKGLKLVVNCIDYENATFHSDPDRIKQIIINLISNSFKFTHHGSITLNVDIWRRKHLVGQSRLLMVEVIDTGIGISDGDWKGLFQLFGTVSKYREQFNMKGAGLGLTVSK